MQIKTRFAPSPTGYFHAGSYRTALFSWIYARQNKGTFVLRIEDTDKERSKKEYEDNIIESLHWLGLDYDEFYRQSERGEAYKKYIKQLIDSGHAFISEESAEGDNTRNEVIRFKNPNKRVIFEDMIRGKVEFDTTELHDFVIAKSLDEPIFHLANVVDDIDSKITHIIRGEDHISNTPRQILIFEALGVKPPVYAHIPLLLSRDRAKLSKRNGAIAIFEYKKRGYLPEAIVNYLSLLGWHPKDDREVLSIQEILRDFSLERVQKGGAIFDDEKLAWFNREYLSRLDNKAFTLGVHTFLPTEIKDHDNLITKILPIIKERIYCFADTTKLFDIGGELAFLTKEPHYDKSSLLWKKEPDIGKTLAHLTEIENILGKIESENFTAETVKETIWPYTEKNGRGQVLWPLRMAITGQDKSPDPFVCADILGKDKTIIRIKQACALLRQ